MNLVEASQACRCQDRGGTSTSGCSTRRSSSVANARCSPTSAGSRARPTRPHSTRTPSIAATCSSGSTARRQTGSATCSPQVTPASRSKVKDLDLTSPRLVDENEAWAALPDTVKRPPRFLRVTEFLRMDLADRRDLLGARVCPPAVDRGCLTSSSLTLTRVWSPRSRLGCRVLTRAFDPGGHRCSTIGGPLCWCGHLRR